MSAAASMSVRLQLFFSRYVTMPRPHRWLYRLTRGLIGSRLPGVNPAVLLLTVPGRRSGIERTTPLVYFEIDGSIVIAGTNNGEDQHPEWFWNLLASKDAVIQLGPEHRRVTCRLVTGPERSRLWRRITTIHPLFEVYQKRTARVIPVLVLEEVE